MSKTQSLFKLENPMDLVSRMFILEYVRELGPEVVKEKLAAGEIKFWLYSFEGEDKTMYDFNWEYLLFVIPLKTLGSIMERFLTEIESIEATRQVHYKKKRQELLDMEVSKPADINLYDLAKADIDNQSKQIIL